MKSCITFVFVIICGVVLAAQQSQAKKGCDAYGYACYGGHGKRSLGAVGNSNGNGQDDMRAEAMMPVMANDGDGDFDAIPRYRLLRMLKTLFGGHQRLPLPRVNDLEYNIPADNFNRDNINSIN